jgi:3D (Asp-Asp-Asp) domain-containing protein
MRALGVLCALLACGGGCKRERAVPEDAPARGEPGASRGQFSLTYYWVTSEVDAKGRADTKVYDRSCHPIAMVPAAFASDLAVAGTGQLADRRTLTVDGECECPRSPCFRVLAAEPVWGIGAENRPLVPFRSLAVDRELIPIGTKLWIEELAGVDMPGLFPELHDGCVVADDTGGRIEGQRIDWFVGREIDYGELDRALHLTKVTVHEAGARCR